MPRHKRETVENAKQEMSEIAELLDGNPWVTREIPLTLSEFNDAGKARPRNDFYYVYRVTGRTDEMEFHFGHSWHNGQTFASFRLAIDAQKWADNLREAGNVVNVMPGAEGILF